jgi:O-antigen ligase
MTVMTALRAKRLDRQNLEQLAGWLAVGVAVSLPWSTSATSVFIVLWLLASLATLDIAALRRELLSAAGGLPVLLWLLAVAGMLWADVAWSERYAGLSGFNRLLIIPLLLTQFRRSEYGMWVFAGFLFSVTIVLLVSGMLVLFPGVLWHPRLPGVPAKDYIIQSEEFLICAFALFGLALAEYRSRRWRSTTWMVALAILFLTDIFFVTTGRTSLLVGPVLVLLLGWRYASWKGLIGAAAVGCIVGGAVWFGSPALRAHMDTSLTELQAYEANDAYNSTGLHLEFLKKSLSFVKTASVVGHGTGSIAEQFRNAAANDGGSASAVSVNPHNQIFAVAIQLGAVGTVVLLAMWVAHLWLFRGVGIVGWIGLVIVVQNVVASLFNSHLFDFAQGWLYVFGVGVAGGMVLRQRDTKSAEHAAAAAP